MTGICPQCSPGSPPRNLIAGLCQFHYWQEKQAESRKKRLHKLQSSITTAAQKLCQVTYLPELPEKSELQRYYDYNIGLQIQICENCSGLIPFSTRNLQISSIAHILPKAKFKSVKAHIFNKLHLCSQFSDNNCHGKYDHSWDKAQKMPVISLALERFDHFKHLILPSEYRFLPDFLRERL